MIKKQITHQCPPGNVNDDMDEEKYLVNTAQGSLVGDHLPIT